MKNFAKVAVFATLFIILNIKSALAVASDIAISEILFDPVGIDTGLEYVVVKNFGIDAINLTGWDLYPDGVGYFTFPDFSLGAGKSVKILLRASGTNDESNLYHSSATGNMSNSSGSVAIFSSTSHNKDTIVSFVRYQKSGSTERKTWESTAASASLWTAGTLVDISSATEGQAIFLKDFSQKTSAQSWGLATSENTQPAPTEQTASADTNTSSGVTDLPSTAYFNPLPAEKIKAYAGKDITALVGAEVNFIGYAEDLKGEPLEGARFIWNFGDGSTGEGKNVLHTYRFPGVYTVFMDSSTGIYSASDTTKVTVIESPLLVSEIKPGKEGWIEIKNDSARILDVSGFGIGNANTKPFYMPPKTVVSPWAEIVFGADVLKFPISNEGDIALFYPNGSVLSKISYQSPTTANEESLNWTGSEWVIAKATPGAKNNTKSSVSKTHTTDKVKTNVVVSNSVSNTIKTADTKTKLPRDGVDLSDSQGDQFTASVVDSASKKFGGYLWLVVGVGGGVLAGILFLVLKKLVFKI